MTIQESPLQIIQESPLQIIQGSARRARKAPVAWDRLRDCPLGLPGSPESAGTCQPPMARGGAMEVLKAVKEKKSNLRPRRSVSAVGQEDLDEDEDR